MERPLPMSDDDTLYLPRILCLHGGGTNARIFRAQCRVLERALRPFFRLCYVQAPFYSKPGPDVISVYKNYGPFHGWLDPGQNVQVTAHEIEKALRRAMADDDRAGATGEFVGLLGFSQGAKICASLLLAQQIRQMEVGQQNLKGMPRWRFGVLLAGRGPLVSAVPEALEFEQFLNVARSSPSLSSPPSSSSDDGSETPLTLQRWNIPTIHVHGLRDPGLHLHRQLLYDSFDLRHVTVIEWDGDHRVPIKTKDVALVVEEAISVARRAGVSFQHQQGHAFSPYETRTESIQ